MFNNSRYKLDYRIYWFKFLSKCFYIIFLLLASNSLKAGEFYIQNTQQTIPNDSIRILELIEKIDAKYSNSTGNTGNEEKALQTDINTLKDLSERLLRNNNASVKKYGKLGQSYAAYFRLMELFIHSSIPEDFNDRLTDLRKSAEESKFDKLSGKLARLEASYYSKFKNDFRESIRHNNAALSFAIAAKDTLTLAGIYNSIAQDYTEIGIYDKAIEFFHKSEKFHKTAFQKYTTNVNISDLYRVMKQYDNSLNFLKKAEDILVNNSLGQLSEINLCLKTATVLIEKKDFITAEKYIDRAVNIIGKDEKNIFIGRIHFTKGKLFYKNGQYENALSEFKESLDFQKRNNFKQRDIKLNNALGWTYLKLDSVARTYRLNSRDNFLKEAEKYFFASYKILGTTQIKENKRDTYKALKIIYERQGDYKKAFEMANLEYAITDSINDFDIKTKLIKQEILHEYQEKRQTDSLRIAGEKLKVQTQVEQKKAENRLLYLGLIILGLILFVLIFLFKYKQQKKQAELQRQYKLVAHNQKEIIKTELDFLKAQINPHFLFNVINSIYFKINRQDSEARDALMGFSNILRYQLYECNQPKVPIEKEVEYIQEYIHLQSLRQSENIPVNLNISENISGFKISPLLLVPFIENAFKYAYFSGEVTDAIDISLELNENLFTFRISNHFNPEDKNKYKDESGIGIQNVKRRLELLYPGDYTLLIEKEEIFAIILTLKIN